MDVTQSHDPFAPEGTDLSASHEKDMEAALLDPESDPEADPQPAVFHVVHEDAPSDVSAPSADSEAQDAPDPATEAEVAVKPEPEFDYPVVEHTVEASNLDPTSPAASDGPTEPEPIKLEPGSPEAIALADAIQKTRPTVEEAATTHDSEPEHEITDERGIDGTPEPDAEQAEPDPTTEGEDH